MDDEIKLAPHPQFHPRSHCLAAVLTSCTFNLCTPYLHLLYMVTAPNVCFCLNSATYVLKFTHRGACGGPSVVTCGTKLSSWRQRANAKEEKVSETKKGRESWNERRPSGWRITLTGNPERIHNVWELSWPGIKCVFALMNVVSPRLAETVEQQRVWQRQECCGCWFQH